MVRILSKICSLRQERRWSNQVKKRFRLEFVSSLVLEFLRLRASAVSQMRILKSFEPSSTLSSWRACGQWWARLWWSCGQGLQLELYFSIIRRRVELCFWLVILSSYFACRGEILWTFWSFLQAFGTWWSSCYLPLGFGYVWICSLRLG